MPRRDGARLPCCGLNEALRGICDSLRIARGVVVQARGTFWGVLFFLLALVLWALDLLAQGLSPECRGD